MPINGVNEEVSDYKKQCQIDSFYFVHGKCTIRTLVMYESYISHIPFVHCLLYEIKLSI